MPEYRFVLSVDAQYAEDRLRRFRAAAKSALSGITSSTVDRQSEIAQRESEKRATIAAKAASAEKIEMAKQETLAISAEIKKQERAEAQKAKEIERLARQEAAAKRAAAREVAAIERAADREWQASQRRQESERRRANAAALTFRRTSMRQEREASARAEKGTYNLGKLDRYLATAFLAYGAYVTTSQIVGGLFNFGKEGAQQERTAQTFEELAQRVGVSAKEMRDAVKTASRGTIDDMTGMQLGAQVLSQSFAGSMKDLAGDTEILIRASRRFSQIFTASDGTQLDTKEVYSRLIQFAREGNKELVDQYGLSNELIAKTLGIPNVGLRGAEGAAQRWRGMIMVLEDSLARLGEATETPADRIERAEARIRAAADRLRAAFAEPVTVSIEVLANIAEAATTEDARRKIVEQYMDIFDSFQTSFWDRARPMPIDTADMPFFPARIREDQASLRAEKIRQDELKQAGVELNDVFVAVKRKIDDSETSLTEQVSAMQSLNDVAGKFRDAWLTIATLQQAGVMSPGDARDAKEEWKRQLAALGAAESITDPFLRGLDDFLADLRSVLAGPIPRPGIAGPNPFTEISRGFASQWRAADVVAGRIAPNELSAEEAAYRLAVGSASERIAILQAAVDGAKVGTEEYYNAIQPLTAAITGLEAQIDATKAKFKAVADDIAKHQLDMRLVGQDTAGQLSILSAYGATLSPGTPEGRANELEVARLSAQLADEAQREWKQTAKEVEQMFESAADKIMGIAGVTSLTPVTGQDVLDTRYGMYQDKPDEWVRRVRDELQDFDRHTRKDEFGVVTEMLLPRKTTDYPDVSREQVERLTGSPPGLPWDVLVPRLERKWESGSLFADKANLGLLNMDAIRGQYDEMKAGATGRQNQRQYIMEQLGVSMADASLITGTQAPIVQMITGGQSEDEIVAQLGPVTNTLRSATMASMADGKGFMNDIVAGWGKDINENIAKLDPLGAMIGQRLRDKVTDTIGGLGLIDSIVARVLAEIAEG